MTPLGRGTATTMFLETHPFLMLLKVFSIPMKPSLVGKNPGLQMCVSDG